MIGQSQYASASELRFILDVMEERSHLGLDNQTARKLREILAQRDPCSETSLLRDILAQRIADAENGIHPYPAFSMVVFTKDS
jgi:hypothetical protein